MDHAIPASVMWFVPHDKWKHQEESMKAQAPEQIFKIIGINGLLCCFPQSGPLSPRSWERVEWWISTWPLQLSFHFIYLAYDLPNIIYPAALRFNTVLMPTYMFSKLPLESPRMVQSIKSHNQAVFILFLCRFQIHWPTECLNKCKNSIYCWPTLVASY